MYHTRSTRHEQIDGAYFGTTFPHLFFLTFPELKPSKSTEIYIPRVFGFKIHSTAYKASLEAKKKQNESANGAQTEAKLVQLQPVADQERDKLKKR